MNVGVASRAAADAPDVSTLVVLAAVACVVELWFLRIARARAREDRAQGRRPPSRLLEIVAWAPVFCTAAASAVALGSARRLMLKVVDPSPESARLVAAGLQGVLDATLVGAATSVLLVVLACWVSGTSIASRRHAKPAPLIAIAMGFAVSAVLPIACVAAANAARFQSALANASGLDPNAQRDLMATAPDSLRAGLGLAFGISIAGIVVTAIAAWLWMQRGASAGGPSVASSVVALSVAVLCVVLSLPMKRENETPWPTGRAAAPALAFQTAQLEGPDPIELGPSVELTPSSLKLERVETSASELATRFQAARSRFDVLHRDAPFTGAWGFACAADTPSARVFKVLAQALRAGYRHPTFLFETRATVQRPWLGAVPLGRVTGAKTTIVADQEPAPAGAIELRAADVKSFADLARRIVGARKSGSSAALRISDALAAAAP
jgi:heme/copper-type cytochrome/quinol oxidase subunit 4